MQMSAALFLLYRYVGAHRVCPHIRHTGMLHTWNAAHGNAAHVGMPFAGTRGVPLHRYLNLDLLALYPLLFDALQ